MNWKRLSPFSVPATIRLAVVLAVGFVLTYVLLVSDPTRIFRWLPIRTGKEVVTRAPDWAQHFVAYLAFSFLLMWYGATKSRWVVPCLIGFAGLHAAATEYLQRFVPHRTSDVKDLVVNFVGIAMGTLLGRIAMWLFGADRLGVDRVNVAASLPRGRATRDDPRFAVRFPLVPPRGSEATTFAGIVAAPLGMSRDAISVSPGELKPSRVLNYGFLGGLCAVTVTLLGTIHAVHGWQVQRHAGALMELGRKAQATGDLNGARDYFGRYVGLVPSDVHARADYGMLLDQMGGKKRQVFVVFEDVLRADPTREDIRRRQIEIAMETGRHLDALAHVRFLRQSYPMDGKLDDQAGQCFEELAEFTDARKAYEAALEHQPNLLDTYRRLAWLCQTRLDRTERAKSLVDSMVERFPKSPTSWLTRGGFRKEFGSLEDAQADIDRALLLDPLGAETQLAAAQLADDRAMAARAIGRYAQARQIAADSRQQLQRAVEQHPGQIDLRRQLVQLETHFGSLAEAQKQFDQLLKLSPRDVRGYMLLAEMNLEQGRFDEARTGVEKLSRTPDLDAWLLFLHGRELMSKNKWAEAIVKLEEARRISTQTAGLSERIDLAVAVCHAEAENFDAETAAYRRALKSNSLSIPARRGLAACLLRQKKVAEAIAEFRSLVHLPPVRLQLVRLLIERNSQLPELAREWTEVDRLLDRSQQEHDDPVAETMLRVESLEARGQLESARQLLEDAFDANRNCVEFAMALSRLAERIGDKQQSLHWKGQALSLGGNSVQAETLLRQACEQHPDDVNDTIALLQHLVRHGQRDEASTLFQSMEQRLKLRERPMELAQCHVVLGHDDAAVAIFRQVLATQPNDSAALRALAKLHLRQNQRSAATPLLNKLLEAEATLPPSEVSWARRQLALALAGQGDSGQRQKGLTLLDRNEQDGTKSLEDWRARAIILAASPRRLDQQAALKLFGELADRQQLLANDRWLMARLFERLGQVEEADTQFRQALDESTVPTDSLAEFIRSLIRRGQLKEADVRLDELRQRDPDSFSTLALELQWQVAGGESVVARKRLEVIAASAKEVERIAQLAGLAESLSRQSSPTASEFTDLSERLYRQCAAGDPRYVVELVRCLSAQGKSSEAFTVCLSEWPRLPAETAARLAMSLLVFSEDRAERMQQIEARLLKGVEQQPRSMMLLTSLADLRGWQERYADSEELYRRVLGLDRENAVAANRLAWLLAMRQQDLDDAQAIIEKQIERLGPTPSLLDTRGCVLLALRRTSAAQQAFMQAHDEAPSAMSCFHLSVAQMETGDTAAARTSFEQAVQLGMTTDGLHPLERQWAVKLAASFAKSQRLEAARKSRAKSPSLW